MNFLFPWYCITLNGPKAIVHGQVKCTQGNFKSTNSFIIFIGRIKISHVYISTASLIFQLVFDFDIPSPSQCLSLLRVMCDHLPLLLKTLLGLSLAFRVKSKLLSLLTLVLRTSFSSLQPPLLSLIPFDCPLQSRD